MKGGVITVLKCVNEDYRPGFIYSPSTFNVIIIFDSVLFIMYVVSTVVLNNFKYCSH